MRGRLGVGVGGAALVFGLGLSGCGGGGHPSAANAPTTAIPPITTTTTAPALMCATVSGPLTAVVNDLVAQAQTLQEGWGSNPPPAAYDIAAGAWVPPGSYANDLSNFLGVTISVNVSTPSQPSQLANDITNARAAALTMTQDLTAPPGDGGPDYPSFVGAFKQVGTDCGLSS
jgi:hypothetical protein